MRRIAYGMLLVASLFLSATEPPTVFEGCNQMRLLYRHIDAAGVRLNLVQTAQQQVDAAYFIFNDDLAGMAGLWFMREAARRGARVRLIVDGQWNKISRSMIHHLMEEGIEVRCYHKFSMQRPLRITRRMHDKLLIVDRLHLVTGGRNIEDAYFGVGEKTYIDTDIYLQGPVAGEAAGYFQTLWQSDRVAPPGGFRVNKRSILRARKLLDQLGTAVKAFPEEMNAMLQDWRREPVYEDDARFLFDPVGEERKSPGIRADLLDLVKETREEIIIESPYLVLTDGARQILQAGLARGVRVRMLTNSLQSTDNLYAQAGYLSLKKRLAGMGVELWEYLGPESLHAKVAIIDGQTTVIGSYNVDPRSERLNTEVAVVVRNQELAHRLRARMDSHLARARRIDKPGQPPPVPLEPMGFWKRLKLQIIRLLLPLIYHQL